MGMTGQAPRRSSTCPQEGKDSIPFRAQRQNWSLAMGKRSWGKLSSEEPSWRTRVETTGGGKRQKHLRTRTQVCPGAMEREPWPHSLDNLRSWRWWPPGDIRVQ